MRTTRPEPRPGWAHPSPQDLRTPTGGFPRRYLLSFYPAHKGLLSALLLELKHSPAELVPWSPRHIGDAVGLA